MHQPQVPLLNRLLLLLATAAAACTRSPSAPPPAAAEAPLRWRLAGQVSANGPPEGEAGLPFEGASALLDRCAGAAPCTAELWRSGASEHRLLRQGDRIWWEEGGAPERQPWPGRWRRLNGTLLRCLGGDPLQAGLPGMWRELVARDPPAEDAEAAWWLHLSGEDACRLEGALLLWARRDRVDTRSLRSGGLLWGAGGREQAARLLGPLSINAR